jgi:hypothetical protein
MILIFPIFPRPIEADIKILSCIEYGKGLGNQEVMGKLIKKNVEIHIGQLTILWDACATKLMDTVLLGLYFLSAQEGLVDLKNLTITFRHEKVCAELAQFFLGLLKLILRYYHVLNMVQ